MSLTDFASFIQRNFTLSSVTETLPAIGTKLILQTLQQPALALCLAITILSLCGFLSKRFIGNMVLSFQSPLEGAQIWRWLTYGFVHQDTAHLGGNLAGIYLTLMSMKHHWPWTTLLLIFAAGIIVPATIVAFIPILRQANTSYLGASCGLFALFGAMAAYGSKSTLMLFYLIPLPLYETLLIVTAVSVGLHLLGMFRGVWHLGHALGAVVGYGLVKYQALAWLGLA